MSRAVRGSVVSKAPPLHEGPVDLPFQGADAESRRAGVVEGIEIATLKVDESTSDAPVGIVIPGCGVGR